MRGYHPRTCVRCGAVMKGTIRRQYCSPKCKVYAYRERKDAARADAFFRAHDLSLAPLDLPVADHVPGLLPLREATLNDPFIGDDGRHFRIFP